MRAKYINEFQRGIDPKTSLGIGQRHFIEKWLNLFESEKMYVTWIDHCNIEGDMKINVNTTFDLSYPFLWSVPWYIKFGTINGGFYTYFNSEKALESGPDLVKGDYHHYYHPGEEPLSEKQIRNFCDVEGEIEIMRGRPIDDRTMLLYKIFNKDES